VLLAAVAAAWASSFVGTFQFDDWNVIVNEPRVASLAAWWGSMPGIRPLLKLSWAANQQSGLGIAGFHAVNLAIHATSAFLVLRLLRRVAERTGATGPGARAAPLFGALLFALHPVQTESVTYLSGRSASMAGALALGSAVAWLSGRERRAGWMAAGLSPLLFAAALATRESAAVLPAALLLLDAVDVRGPFRPGDSLRAQWAHLAVLGVAGVLFAASPVYVRMAARSVALRPPWVNLLTHLDAVAWLGRQVVRIDRQVADPALPVVHSLGPRVALAGAAILGALILGLVWLRRRPALAFGVLWFLVWLPPTGWWLPRPEPASERQLYLAILGPAWLGGLWLARWAAAGGIRRLAAGAVVVALGSFTAARARVYADEVSFWEDAVAKAPGNPRAHANLGFALAARCRTAEAEAALERALELDPAQLRAAVNLRLLREGLPLGPREPACPSRAPAPPTP
jgi:tetratricopeptide (TPR) repeat protein